MVIWLYNYHGSWKFQWVYNFLFQNHNDIIFNILICLFLQNFVFISSFFFHVLEVYVSNFIDTDIVSTKQI